MQNPFQLIRGIVAFARVVKDPDRLGEVFMFIEKSIEAYPGLVAPVIKAFEQTPYGTKSVREKTRLGRVTLEALERFPDGSLGRAYAKFMRDGNLDPAALPDKPARNEAEYVSAHLTETHDIWHVVTGFGPDRAGELGLQAFYLAQFPSRVAVGILTMGFANALLFEFHDTEKRMDEIVRGWVLGRRAKSLLGVDWKHYFQKPLEEVRAELGIDLEGDRLINQMVHERASRWSHSNDVAAAAQ